MSAFSRQHIINPIVDKKETSVAVACPGCIHCIPKERAPMHFEDCKREYRDDVKLNGCTCDERTYIVNKVLREGWLLKKGSGNDWLKSRAWKSRWARLVLASVEGSEIDVPILEVFWHNASLLPSSSIFLDSSVIVPMNRVEENEHKTLVNSFCLDIVSTMMVSGKNEKVIRSFALDDVSTRDAWVAALLNEIVEYGKRKISTRVHRARSPTSDLYMNPSNKKNGLPPISPPTSPFSQTRAPLHPISSYKLPRPNEEHLTLALPMLE